MRSKAKKECLQRKKDKLNYINYKDNKIMTLITKGMGAIAKKLFKKSKKFPGPKAVDQLNKRVEKRGKGISPKDVDTYARIGRTQRYRDILATQKRALRKDGTLFKTQKPKKLKD